MTFEIEIDKDGELLTVQANKIEKSKHNAEMMTVIVNNGRTGFCFDVYTDRIQTITLKQ